MSIRDEILALNDSQLEKVIVPEWGRAVWVRTLSGRERDLFEEQSLVSKGKRKEVSLQNIRARLVVLCACTEDGKPIFQRDDAMQLGDKSAKALDRVFTVAQRLNGITDSDIEELVKN
jgi:hypothetical protein